MFAPIVVLPTPPFRHEELCQSMEVRGYVLSSLMNSAPKNLLKLVLLTLLCYILTGKNVITVLMIYYCVLTLLVQQ